MKAENTYTPRIKPLSRSAYRFGVLATACLGAAGLAAGAAEAIAGTGLVTTSAHALANPAHPDVFQDSLEVHQLGTVLATGARNQAEAESVSCSAARPCRSVSLSFQIVTMVGEQSHLNAVNLSSAKNVHCPGCESLAVAYQFILSTDNAFTLSPSTRQDLGRIHDQLNTLASSNTPPAQLKADADALAGQVTSILDNALAAAPKSAHPATSAGPLVTVHRMVDQH
jgi:hypothetical protein